MDFFCNKSFLRIKPTPIHDPLFFPLQIDTGKQIKKRTFKVGKKRKFQVQLSSAKMAKASQAMEIESWNHWITMEHHHQANHRFNFGTIFNFV